MKKIGLLCLLAVIVSGRPALASSAWSSPIGGVVAHGAEVPFPFGTEIPFPWSSIEGMWEVRDREVDAYFSFQVQDDGTGAKVLKVVHIDRLGRRVFGEGAGFTNPEQKIVRAVMRAANFNYLIFVRVFRDAGSKASAHTTTVLTFRYFGEAGESDSREKHYVLRRVLTYR